jgi:type II secretory ATPase GspE/PulE/Tfp pilus assembly ATPase PilB-like protein
LGIPIHNLLNSVKLIIAQRLLRKLCKYCGFLKKSPNYTEEIPSQVIRPLSKPATKSKLQEFSASKIGVNTQIAEDLSVESVQQAKLEVDFEPKANIKFKCDKCHFGYHGRNAIFEVMPISHQITKILSSKHFDLTQLENIACAEGMQLLKNAGLELVNRGITSLEELGRVVAI